MQHKHSNHLAQETSPYLLQHAHNPVDWYPWGEEALAKAKAEGKPILVSIGYSTCHWCHVMERESFEDEQVADYMNKYFVNIKVDREERPDVDSIYMDKILACKGRVLEVGVGIGRFFIEALKQGADIYGIDVSAPMLTCLKAKIPQSEWDRVEEQSVTAMQLNGQFDLIVAPF